VNSAHGRFCRIIELRVIITMFLQLLHALLCVCAQIIKPAEHDRFGRTNFCTRRNQAALLPVITECALERAAGIGQRFRSSVDHAKRAGDHAITASIANIVLHKDGTDLSPHDRACRACFKTTGFFAMLANIGQKNPAERIFTIAIA
jgi:hypothetical protein